MEKFYKLFTEYLSNSDLYPKNSIIYNINYDCDTILGTPNIIECDDYSEDKKCYCDYEYDECFESNKGMSPRGEWYNLVLVRNGKIIAFGDEQGNYAGGIYAANDFNYERFLTEKDNLKEYPELYNKIKDIPLAEKNEYPKYINKKYGKK